MLLLGWQLRYGLSPAASVMANQCMMAWAMVLEGLAFLAILRRREGGK